MKLAIVTISNKKNELIKLAKSIKKIGINCDFFVCAQEFDNILFQDDEVNITQIIINPKSESKMPVPFAKLRRNVMKLAADYSDYDYFWQLDDDHILRNSNGNTYCKTSYQYHEEVFEYLSKNPQTGVLSIKGFLGGANCGYSFLKNPKNGLISTNKGGLILKNIGIDNICNEYESKLLGALEESLFAYNIMSNGYDYVVRFNSSTYQKPCSAKIGNIINISYSDETVNSNIQGYIRKKFDDPVWYHSSKLYPNKIAKILGIKQNVSL